MKKVASKVRITEADTVSDALVRLYKDFAGKDGALAKDAALGTIMGEVERLSADITTAIKANKVSSSLEDADSKRDGGKTACGHGQVQGDCERSLRPRVVSD